MCIRDSALRGLSSPETSRQGNLFGIIGMIIAIGVTIISIGNFSFVLIYFVLLYVVMLNVVMYNVVRYTVVRYTVVRYTVVRYTVVRFAVVGD